MTFARVNALGWALFETLSSAQMNALDTNMTNALDGLDGGPYAPSAPVVLDGSLAPAATRMIEITGRDGGGAVLVQAGTGGAINRAGYFRGGDDVHPVYADAPLNANIAGTPLSRVYGVGQANDAGPAGAAIGGVGGASTTTFDAGAGVDVVGGVSVDRVGGIGGKFTGGASDAADVNAVGGQGTDTTGGQGYEGGRGGIYRGGRSLDTGAPASQPYGLEVFGGTRAVGDQAPGTAVIGRGGVVEAGTNQSGGVGVHGSGADGVGNGNGGAGIIGFGGDGGDGGNGVGGYGGSFTSGQAGAGENDDAAAILLIATANSGHIHFSSESSIPAPSVDLSRRKLRAFEDGMLWYGARAAAGVADKWLSLVPIMRLTGYAKGGAGGGLSSVTTVINNFYNVDTAGITNDVSNFKVTIPFEDTLPVGLRDYVVHANYINAAAQGGNLQATPLTLIVHGKSSTGIVVEFVNLASGASHDVEAPAATEHYGFDISIYPLD